MALTDLDPIVTVLNPALTLLDVCIEHIVVE